MIKLTKISNKLGLSQPLQILTQKDVEKLVDEIEDSLEQELHRTFEDSMLKKQAEVTKILLDGRGEMSVNGSPKMFSLTEKIKYPTPYLDEIEVEFKNILEEKPLSADAIKLFEEFIVEILSRVDQGGFAMTIPTIDILETLNRLSQAVTVYARVYSQESKRIETDHINDAIVYLDSRYTIHSIISQIKEERGVHR